MKYFPLTLCAVAALAACDAQTARPRTEPGIAGGFMPAATAEAAAKSVDPAEYRLTMDLVRRVIAAQRNLALVEGTDPGEAAHSTLPIDEQVARLEAQPALRAAVERTGLSTREQAVASWVLFQAAVAQGVIDGGGKQDDVLGTIRIAPENVAFYRANQAQIARLRKAMEDEVNEGEVISGGLLADLPDEN
ncbi:MAG TPA: hypothetical protein VF710_04450 [Longimicrobium sp.]|jgi:hypothetical protein